MPKEVKGVENDDGLARMSVRVLVLFHAVMGAEECN
jgi:hypothetical protein